MQAVIESRMVASALEKCAHGCRTIETSGADARRPQHDYHYRTDSTQSHDRDALSLQLALDNGVKPREISEIITHLAFYSGWANAMAAVVVAKDAFFCLL